MSSFPIRYVKSVQNNKRKKSENDLFEPEATNQLVPITIKAQKCLYLYLRKYECKLYLSLNKHKNFQTNSLHHLNL